MVFFFSKKYRRKKCVCFEKYLGGFKLCWKGAVRESSFGRAMVQNGLVLIFRTCFNSIRAYNYRTYLVYLYEYQ